MRAGLPAVLADRIGERAARLDRDLLAIPGVVGTGLFLAMADLVLVADASGKVVATLVNYAIHPEVIGRDRGVCSPDLVGPLYDRIAEKGGGIAVFMNSAQGGMVTADNRQANGQEARTWAECQRIGNLLADEALRASLEED